MKHLIMWGGLLITTTILFIIYDKVSVTTTFFELDRSPIYADIIFLIFGAVLVITRGAAIIAKLF